MGAFCLKWHQASIIILSIILIIITINTIIIIAIRAITAIACTSITIITTIATTNIVFIHIQDYYGVLIHNHDRNDETLSLY